MTFPPMLVGAQPIIANHTTMEGLTGYSGTARYEPSLAAAGLGMCCALELERHDTVCPFRSVFGHKRTLRFFLISDDEYRTAIK
jgi:hypothetical protein